ncbi:TatD family hydrolase [Lachnospiraceae bacterium ZAX-1]
MIFESHAHYDDKQFAKDRDELLSSMKENGIETIINVGTNIYSSQKTIELTKQYDLIYGAIGVHPSDISCLNEDRFEWLKGQCHLPKVVAIGEIGLDYYWDKEVEVRECQKVWFKRQLELAREVKLPVIIHSRDAAQDTLDLMKQQDAQEIAGVIHCFSYSEEMAAEYIKMGYYIGIGGVVTFPNAKKIKEAVKKIPIERILLETDCPYLAPMPNRGKRNTSLYIPYIAEEIAQIKEITVEEVVAITNKNARALFKKVQ